MHIIVDTDVEVIVIVRFNDDSMIQLMSCGWHLAWDQICYTIHEIVSGIDPRIYAVYLFFMHSQDVIQLKIIIPDVTKTLPFNEIY